MKTRSVLLVFIMLVLFAFTGCEGLEYETKRDYKSPSGNKVVTVKIDYVSRPDVFYNGECIFKYDRTGFTETVPWDVKWNSEDEIELYLADGRAKYKNERYVIKIPAD